MNVRTHLKSGADLGPVQGRPQPQPSQPYINKWDACWRCKGKKDQYGNLSNASCNLCWPPNRQPPV
jgi:hypothetical protein